MTEHLSAFAPDGIDRFDEQEACRAALDCVNAVDQLLRTTKLHRRGTEITENAILRCFYDLDRAVADATHYRACHPVPLSPTTPCADAAKLAAAIRTKWMRAVAEWKIRPNTPSDGWSCLWQLYEQHFGHTVGPTWGDAVSHIEESDADEHGLINSCTIYIPQDVIEHQWHFDAWPFVCEQLAQFCDVDVIALARALTEQGSEETGAIIEAGDAARQPDDEQPSPTTDELERAARAEGIVGDGITIDPGNDRDVAVKDRGLAVTVKKGEDGLVLYSDGLAPLAISADESELFKLFVTKVAFGSPGEYVALKKLNYAVRGDVAPEDIEKASDQLRTAISRLNDRLSTWTTPPGGGPWIKSKRRKGYYLNESVSWPIGDKDLHAELTRYSASVFGMATEPSKMADNTPSKGQRLPSRPRREPPADNHGSDDD